MAELDIIIPGPDIEYSFSVLPISVPTLLIGLLPAD